MVEWNVAIFLFSIFGLALCANTKKIHAMGQDLESDGLGDFLRQVLQTGELRINDRFEIRSGQPPGCRSP
jgi:hypothetical protein